MFHAWSLGVRRLGKTAHESIKAACRSAVFIGTKRIVRDRLIRNRTRLANTIRGYAAEAGHMDASDLIKALQNNRVSSAVFTRRFESACWWSGLPP
jgi:hypothetical protein